MGLLFAFLALFSWGFGDFFIQKCIHKFGNVVTLFFIGIIGAIIIFPFILNDLAILFSDSRSLIILGLASISTLFAALFNFEGLKQGKLAVIVGIYALEVPLTSLLSYFVIDEKINLLQTILISLIVFGIFSLSVKKFEISKKMNLEKGVLYAIFGTIFMSVTNFLFGLGGRETSPLMVNFTTSLILAIFCFFFLMYRNELTLPIKHLKHNTKLIIGMTILDNFAWIFYTYSMFLIPIAIATGISESCIALSALLGIIINKEKLEIHQKIGLSLTLISSIVLALISK